MHMDIGVLSLCANTNVYILIILYAANLSPDVQAIVSYMPWNVMWHGRAIYVAFETRHIML